ncbi:MAG: sigma-70 family RNA polymerase sigma factor [bacterium]
MKNLRVEVKLKNNILYRAIYDNYGSVANFCRLNKKFNGVSLGLLINLRMSPLRKTRKRRNEEKHAVEEEYRTICDNLSFILGIPVEVLFPLELYKIERTRLTAEVNFTDLLGSVGNPFLLPAPSDPYQEIEERERTEETMRILTESLTPRELQVIKMRFGLGNDVTHTLEEVGKEFGVRGERIRQIEGKALKKLQHRKNKSQLEKIHFS